ncbi:hypothetical protein [Qipengyuania nanhaisediminis]|uniref:hypothetical protein n=1 Tax=Qipengyuania nanhaisediminis TaxID=604088 RepID=UPI0038B248B7
MDLNAILTLAVALGFAAIQLSIGRFHMLEHRPRNIWLSLGGGIAVAYVFLHILPELSHHQRAFVENIGTAFIGHELFVFALALTGLLAFYLLDRWAIEHAAKAEGGDEHAAERRIAQIHTASFTAYSAMIGYLLARGEPGTGWALATFAAAIAVHILVTGHAVRRAAPERFDSRGRWLLASGMIGGWIAGQFVAAPDLIIGGFFAILGGGVILNTLREELPEERESKPVPFILGAVAYSALIVAETMIAQH